MSVLYSALTGVSAATAAEPGAMDMHFLMHSLVLQGLSCGLIC